MSAPLAATTTVVLSPSMSSQMRCASASWRPPSPAPSIFSSSPATDRSRSTWTGRIGAVRYFVARGLRWVTMFDPLGEWRACDGKWRRGRGGGLLPVTSRRSPSAALLFVLAVDGEVGVGVDARLVELDHLGALGLRELAA